MDSKVQCGMESVKLGKQTGSIFIQGLLFMAGDYMALVLAGVLSLFIRNELITRTVFHVSPAYLYVWVPLVFMAFIFYEGLYSWRYLTYEITKKLIFASLGGIVFAVFLCSLHTFPEMFPVYSSSFMEFLHIAFSALFVSS